jgi:hypothetical protein
LLNGDHIADPTTALRLEQVVDQWLADGTIRAGGVN